MLHSKKYISSSARCLIIFLLCILLVNCDENTPTDMDMYESRLITGYSDYSPLHIKWLGTAAIWISDGETAILIDPHVTRPSLSEITLGYNLDVDQSYIREWVDTLGTVPVKAVIVSHSHYDHALDAPGFAVETGAKLIGSESTANIGRGFGMPEGSLQSVIPGDSIIQGNFTITFLESLHGGTDMYPGDITESLEYPARASDYRSGTTFAILLDHPAGSTLHHNSPAWIPDMYSGKGITADLVLLGLGNRDDTSEYIKSVVIPVMASAVIPIHFDSFMQPIEDGLSFMSIPDVDMAEFFTTCDLFSSYFTVYTLPFAADKPVDVPVP